MFTKEDLWRFLKETVSFNPEWGMHIAPRPNIECNDGFKLSVQASSVMHCTPRDDLWNGKYETVEVGYPSERVPEFENYVDYYGEEPIPYTEAVYAFIPIKIVADVIDQHGGIRQLFIPYR